MKQDKQKHNWLIDAGLLGGFLVALWLDLTGAEVHQWLGVAVTALGGYHLWKHRRWVEMTSRLTSRASRQSRLLYAVDAGLAAGFAAMSVSGLVISIWLDLPLGSYAVWRDIHMAVSVATLGWWWSRSGCIGAGSSVWPGVRSSLSRRVLTSGRHLDQRRRWWGVAISSG